MTNNPCKQCIVSPMCKEGCDKLSVYVNSFIPKHMYPKGLLKNSMKSAHDSIRQSVVNDRISYIIAIYYPAVIHEFPLLKLIIRSGEIIEVRENDPNREPNSKMNSRGNSRFHDVWGTERPGFDITIIYHDEIHEGVHAVRVGNHDNLKAGYWKSERPSR